MLKIGNLALLALLGHAATAEDCTGVISKMPGTCDWSSFIANLAPTCSATELAAYEADFGELCAKDSLTQFVEIQGTYQLDRRYFHGGGPLVDGGNWELDSAQIKRFEANSGSGTIIEFPDYAARVQYNINTGQADPDDPNGYPANMNLYSGCDLQTVMCCFTDGGEAGFAANTDATTDVCHHEHELSPESNFIEEGWQVMPGTETPTHCVGFTFTDKDSTSAPIGNMMYDVSLRNSALKGYKDGIPGAPMCGCVEHMPVVGEASCRTASASNLMYHVHLDEEGMHITNTADVSYSDCGDLKAAVIAADPSKEAEISKHLVGPDPGCADEVTDYLNDVHLLAEKASPTYLFPDPSKWSDLVVGEGINFQPPDLDPAVADAKFRDLLNAGCLDLDDQPRACIVRRTCGSCQEAYRDVYYRRFSDIPTEAEMTALVDNVGHLSFMTFLYLFTDEWVQHYNDMSAGDFKLYSSYDDAINDNNPWAECDYGNFDGYGFPRNCGPDYRMWNNWNSYVRRGHGYANHHGFYVELP